MFDEITYALTSKKVSKVDEKVNKVKEDLDKILPTNEGESGQAIIKTEDGTEWATIEGTIPEGGETGQVLTKTEDSYAWKTTSENLKNDMTEVENDSWTQKTISEPVVGDGTIVFNNIYGNSIVKNQLVPQAADPIDIQDWDAVSKQIAAGEHPFLIGQELIVHRGEQEIPFRVLAYDHHKRVDDPNAHTMTLEMKYVYEGLESFDYTEALYYAENSLEPGSYYFTVKNQAWYPDDNDVAYYFTLTKEVPAGGCIILRAPTYNKSLQNKMIATYTSLNYTVSNEYATLSSTPIEGAINLGETDGNTENMNHMHRALLGSNNYAQSYIRQWLNAPGIVYFSVETDGIISTYQWEYRANSTSDWERLTTPSAIEATLKVHTTDSMSGYQYRCIMTDNLGNNIISEVATLTIVDGPVIKTQPKDVITRPGAVTFSVNTQVKGTGIVYSWQYSKDNGITWLNPSGIRNKESLSVNATTSMNGYIYRCTVTDGSLGKATVSDIATLTVSSETVITKQPNSIITHPKSVVFSVEADGDELTYQWYYSTNDGATWKASTAATGASANYSVNARADINGYLYRCTITDGSGNSINSNTVSLTVISDDAAIITMQPSNIVIASSANRFWNAQTKFKVLNYTHTIGFTYSLDNDFLTAVKIASIPCRTNSVYEVNSFDGTEFSVNQTYNLEDKFFLLSRPEIYGSWDSASYKDGELLDYYDGTTQQEKIKYNEQGQPRVTWLRSPNPDYGSVEYGVNTTGSLIGTVRTSASAYRAVACII